MGIFDTETTVVVSSVLYSLSGDTDTRPNYLKSSLYASLMTPKGISMVDAINRSYLTGPGISQRNFFNWAVQNNFEGLPTHALKNYSVISDEDMIPHIDVPETPEGLVTTIDYVLVTIGDYVPFADQFLLEYYSYLYYERRTYTYDVFLNNLIMHFTDLADAHPDKNIGFDVIGYDPDEQYVTAYFTQKVPEDTDTPDPQIYIYQVGSGNTTLDALANPGPVETEPEFYPYIPIRLNNQSITHSTYISNGFYDECKLAYRKSFGSGNRNSFADLVNAIEDNEDLAEIDYCYVTYGVPLNTEENSGKKYIHAFLKSLIPLQQSSTGYRAFVIDRIANALGNPVPIKYTTIELTNSSSNTSSFRMELVWISIEEDLIEGLAKPTAKTNDVFIELGTPTTHSFDTIHTMYVYKQIDATNYSRLTVFGLRHYNYIYGSENVRLTASDALSDEEETPFLIPMHNPTFRAMSTIDRTQIALENSYLLFNTYQIYKKNWYEKGAFRIIIVVAVVVVAVLLAPVTLGASVGLLGTNLAVGTALGLSGISAIMAGAIINSLAAVILTEIIMRGSTELFGDKYGLIIGSVISFVLFTGFTGGFNFSNFASTDSVMQLSNVLANSYTGWVNAEISEMNALLGDKIKDYENSLKTVNDLLKDLNGDNDLSFNPIQLTDVGNNNFSSGTYLPENLDDFIYRTTLVGSDIVEITLAMITDFTDLSLQLPKN